MKKTWRAAVTCAAVGAAMLGGTGAAQAAQTDTFSFTAEEYAAVPFGTDRATVWQTVVGAPTSPPPGSASGWCENSTMTIQCFTASGDYVPYGNFNFNSAGQLVSKQNELLYKPVKPSMTLAKYNKVYLGMTETQFWSVVSKDSCVDRGEAYPNWPATTGHKLSYKCDAGTGLFSPSGYFDLTDGKVTYKYQRALT
ncbi:BLIP family protein [Streptomyces sp. NPDC003943]